MIQSPTGLLPSPPANGVYVEPPVRLVVLR